jgi:hypothetical protein
MKYIINVTSEDIASGEREMPETCAIALAATRAGLRDVVVGDWLIACEAGEGSIPVSAAEFISDFDHGRPVSPMAFEVDIQPLGSFDLGAE